MHARKMMLPVGLLLFWLLLIWFGVDAAHVARSFLFGSSSAVSVSLSPERTGTDEGMAAFVYSRYPFNLKDELLVDRGATGGVSVGDVVSTLDHVYIGEVTEVFNRKARVRTIFDADTQIAVRIGPEQVDAVLEGGPNPQLSLISQGVSQGDAVHTADQGAPYGMFVGEVRDISISKDQLFRNAHIAVSYNPVELREVLIIKSP